jgi:competence protein ComGC
VRRTIDRGAVLIEVAIVLVILAGLAVLGQRAVHRFSTFESAAGCRSDKRNVQDAVAAYLAERGSWAPDVDALVAAGLLVQRPGGTGYTISYDGLGTVTASGACT